MAVTDIQSWADNLELVRLPAVTSDISDLTAAQAIYAGELNTKTQQLSDRLDVHRVDIDKAQTDAISGINASNQALSSIYQTDLDATTYTNQKFQEAINELDARFDQLNLYLDGDYALFVDSKIDGEKGTFQQAVDAAVAQAVEARNYLNTNLIDMDGVNDDIINNQIPSISQQIQTVDNSFQNTKLQIDTVFAGFEYSSVASGFDALVEKSIKNITGLRHSNLKLPASLWTNDSTSLGLGSKPPAAAANFLDNDPEFRDCYEFDLGANQTMGLSEPTYYEPNKVYRLTARYRVVNDGTSGGVLARMGVSTWDGDILSAQNVQKALSTNPITVADGPQTVELYFSDNLTKLQDAQLSIGVGAANNAVHVGSTGSPKKAFFHFRQNPGLFTNGQIRLDYISIEDANEVFNFKGILQEARDAANVDIQTSLSELKTEIEDPNGTSLGATVQQNYASITGPNGAIALSDEALKAAIEDPNGSSVGAALEEEKLVRANVDTSIASNVAKVSASVGRGNGVLADQYLTGGTGWSDWNLGPNVGANEIYPTGSTFSWDVTSESAGVSMKDPTTVSWPGMKNAPAYRVEIEFTLVSGSLDGASFLLDWKIPTTKRRVYQLADMIPEGEEIHYGKPMLAERTFARPIGVDESVFTDHRIYFMANWSGAGTKTAKHIKVHRIQIYPITTTEASVVETQQAVATLEGYAAATYSLGVVSGEASAGLQIVASDGPDTVADSSLRLYADNILFEGEVYARHLNAEVFNADLINAGQMSVGRVVVDRLLRVNAAEGGITVGKSNAYDGATDGTYFGRTEENDGTTGFGFSASRIDSTGREQSLEITKKNGVRIQNANFVRELGVAPAAQNLTTSNTYSIDALTRTIGFSMQAAGGGGGNGEDTEFTPGQDGGNTVVELRDGATLITSWTASGGAGGSSAVNTGTSAAGQDSAFGSGGTAGRGRRTKTTRDNTTEGGGTNTTVYPATAGGNATGYGAGGGAGGDPNADQAAEGGKAGQLKVFEDIDVSGLTDPNIVVTIGSKGSGSTSAEKHGGDGSDGLVELRESTTEQFAADVIPMKPTFSGTMASRGDFPDHGAGMWVLTRPTGELHVAMGDFEINDSGEIIRFRNAACYTFISSKTPVRLNTPYSERTIRYHFYKMGP